MKRKRLVFYELLICDSFYLNQYNQFKQCLSVLFEQMAERHLFNLNLNVDDT
jgi:hypothetical protein